MRIQHNISAMNAERNLRKNRGSLQKKLEKLSSGYRINRSADDAAGLAISEKMRASIAALEQAENNVQDGISLVQTADGAMQEIQDMLNRMTSLSAQAANGTLSDEERAHIQEEIDEILKEITRIKNDTDFNGIPVLQGDNATTTTSAKVLGNLPAWVTSTSGGTMKDTYQTSETATITTTTTNPDGTTSTTTRTEPVNVNHSAAKLDFSALNASNVADLVKDTDNGFYTTCCTCDNHYSIKFNSGNGNSVSQSGSHYIYNVDITGVTTGEQLVDAILSVTGKQPQSHFTTMVKDPANPGQLIIFDERPSDRTHMAGLVSGESMSFAGFSNSITKPSVSSGYGLFGEGVAYDKSVNVIGDIVLQIGEGESSSMEIDLPDMALDKIGITGLNVTDPSKAVNALSKLKSGLGYVSGERGRMGAYQNRLEHTYEYLGNTVENLTRSESQIRDADMAEEMMAYTKNSILTQSAQAMLAQSNQVPQNVLQLMQ